MEPRRGLRPERLTSGKGNGFARSRRGFDAVDRRLHVYRRARNAPQAPPNFIELSVDNTFGELFASAVEAVGGVVP